MEDGKKNEKIAMRHGNLRKQMYIAVFQILKKILESHCFKTGRPRNYN